MGGLSYSIGRREVREYGDQLVLIAYANRKHDPVSPSEISEQDLARPTQAAGPPNGSRKTAQWQSVSLCPSGYSDVSAV